MSHVLIVDDEPAICWAFRECLNDEGMTVDIAGTAEQAFQLTADRTPDVIVMDIRLPGMDGLTALRQLRRSFETVPIIIMTAFGSLRTAVSAIDGGAFDYLTKPIDLEKALAVVRQAISKAQLGQAVQATVQSATAGDADDGVMVGRSPAMKD
ncbi:MAG: sigma-54-dependent transcriptional regulator, partial [Planctomycetota bacterium]